MPTPLLSICLPNLNTRPFLEPRMQSILAQTNRDWELVILDSFSDDGSWEFFQKFKGDPRIRMFQAPRAGLYPGWNECLQAAQGKYIHIATSDDTEAPDFQEKLLTLLEAQPDCHLAYCRHQEIDGQGSTMPEHPAEKREFMYNLPATPVRRAAAAEAFHSFAMWAPWFTLNALVFRRSLLQKAGLFPTHMGRHGDTAWAWRATLQSDTLFCPEILANWRRHESQATKKQSGTRTGLEMRMIIEQARKFLAEHSQLVPASWRAVPGWQHRLMAYRYHEVRQNGGLTREGLRSHPGTFLQTALWSLQLDRGFLLSQAATGFGYPSALSDDFPFRAFLEAAKRDFQLPEQQALA